ncbi:MAG TPA: peptidylprolyl isomerase [Blastocatellia bacterium]|nr:peptidylprolyl isomerase [Blastocatellia bacterium]
MTFRSRAPIFIAAEFMAVAMLAFHTQASFWEQTGDSRKALMDPRDQVWQRHAPEIFWVTLETSKGSFLVECHRDWAPIGADRFYNLVATGFFDDSRFFRVRAGFIAQFGIPGEPSVAAVWQHQSIPDDPRRQSNVRGSIAYAMTGPDTRTTQLYINLGENTRLDAEGFAPMGKVVQGMEVVDKLYSGYDETAGGGMRGGKQGPVFEGGNAYLDKAFPKLDRLVRSTAFKSKPAALRPISISIDISSIGDMLNAVN